VVAKVALVGVLAGGSVVAGEVAIEQIDGRDAAQVAPARDSARGEAVGPDAPHPPVATQGENGELISSERNRAQRGLEQRSGRAGGHAYAGSRPESEKPESTNSAGGRRIGAGEREARIERSAPGRLRDRTSNGSAERPSAPVRPERELGAPRERPTPQVKAVEPPVQESGAPVPVPEATPSPDAAPDDASGAPAGGEDQTTS